MIDQLRSRLAGVVGSSGHRARQLSIEEPIHPQPEDLPGELLRVRPYVDNEGMPAGATFLRSIYDPSVNRLGRNCSDHHAFEIWFHDGTVAFYLHAADEQAGSNFRRRLANTYPNSEAVPVSDGSAFPAIRPSSYVAGARVSTRRHYYYPIRHHNSDGFASDPFSQLINEMRSEDGTSVVLQVVFRPAKRSWATGDRFRPNGAADLAHDLRQSNSVGWLAPRERRPSEEDERIATRLERQTGRVAFHTNVRILVVSDDPTVATTRLRGLEDTFGTLYDAPSRQGLEAEPITHWNDRLQTRRLRSFLDRMIDRQWVDREMILTVPELAGLAHLPNEEIGSPDVDWCHTSRGDWIPTDAPQFGDVHDRHSGTQRPDVGSAGGE